MIYEFDGNKPEIGDKTFVCDSAVIIGNVIIGKSCFIGPGARIRGDFGRIEIGSFSAVEDNCIIHARPDEKTMIGEHVTVGHGAILHNCTVEDWVVVGMGAVVSDYALVREWCAVGEGAVVRNKQRLSKGAIAVGVPAKEIGQTSPGYRRKWTKFKEMYDYLSEVKYPETLKQIKTGDG